MEKRSLVNIKKIKFKIMKNLFVKKSIWLLLILINGGITLNAQRGSFGATIEFADLDKDGDNDLITSNKSFDLGIGAIMVYEKTRTGFVMRDYVTTKGTGSIAIGDFNGDRRLDIAIGYANKKPAGYVNVYTQTQNFVFEFSKKIDQSGLGANEIGDKFGTSLSSGDYNNDGFDDLLVGAPGEAPEKDPASGAVFYFKGSSSGLVGEDVYTQNNLGSNEDGDLFGYKIVSGDFDNDGFDDAIIGAPGEAPGNDPESGCVFLFKGNSNGLAINSYYTQKGLGRNEKEDFFGAVMTVGDFNRDGYQDLVVGNYNEKIDDDKSNCGAAFLFYGSQNKLLSHQLLTQEKLGINEANDRFSTSLASGDINGDGFDDLIVGATGESPGNDPESGYAFFFSVL